MNPDLGVVMPDLQADLADKALMQRIAQGDQAALADLYDRYGRILLGVAYRIVRSREDAEEVVLDSFCQVWRSAHRYNSNRGRVDTWLFAIIRSRALDRLRSLRRSDRSRHVAQTFLSEPPHVNPHEQAIWQEQRAQICQALAQIPLEQRQVIELAYFDGLSQAEIALQLQIPVGTVKTRLRLGLQKLRQGLLPDAESTA